jgi:hypothetical protein
MNPIEGAHLRRVFKSHIGVIERAAKRRGTLEVI